MTTFLMLHGSCRIPLARMFAVVMVFAAWAAPVGALAVEADRTDTGGKLPDDFVTWRFTWDNDVVVNSDNQFSNGMSLQMHGPPARSWDGAVGTPAFGKSMARWFLPDRRGDLYFREGWSVGHSIQTPDDIDEEDLIEDDVPYAAALAAQNTWIAYNDRRLYGFGWLMGVIGPSAKGEEVQTAFHKLIGSDEPMGWDNQINNELLINFYYEQKWKLVGSSFGDISAGMDARLGNLITAAEVKLEGRLGWHVPGGFLYVPDPIGRRLSYDAHLSPREVTNWTFYGSVSAGMTVFGYSAFYDGNLFRDSHSIETETILETVVFGLHYQRFRWGFHLNLAFSTDLVDTYAANDEPDPTDNYGSLMMEFRH